MKLAMIMAGALAIVAPAVAQDRVDPAASYRDAVACAGKFRWVLDSSSGGQPALNEYSLDERVKGIEVFTEKAEAIAADMDPAPDVAQDVQSVADDTIGAFFDDPDTVEAELLECAIAIGMRDE